jgi:hypothetical protein
MNVTIFDCETGSIPQSELLKIIDPFDPADVKTGNIKDVDKIAAKIDECREKYYKDAMDNAALSALTGRVLAIGLKMMPEHKPVIIGHDSEADTLLEFWSLFSNTPGKWVGFNIFGFDLPFLARRSWVNKVKVPFIRKGRYWADEFVDLREVWQAGDRQAEGSLDSISRALGLGQKSGDGADFSKLWSADRPKAEEYLRNDLALTEALYLRMVGA